MKHHKLKSMTTPVKVPDFHLDKGAIYRISAINVKSGEEDSERILILSVPKVMDDQWFDAPETLETFGKTSEKSRKTLRGSWFVDALQITAGTKIIIPLSKLEGDQEYTFMAYLQEEDGTDGQHPISLSLTPEESQARGSLNSEDHVVMSFVRFDE